VVLDWFWLFNSDMHAWWTLQLQPQPYYGVAGSDTRLHSNIACFWPAAAVKGVHEFEPPILQPQAARCPQMHFVVPNTSLKVFLACARLRNFEVLRGLSCRKEVGSHAVHYLR